MTPTVGHLVHYCLGPQDVLRIRRRRESFSPIDANEVAHVEVGEVYPMLIVKVHADERINGHVFLDGVDVLWAVHVALSGESVPGTWRWPDLLITLAGAAQ